MANDKKILVTGATGFIGAAVVRALVKQGITPRVLVRRNSDRHNLEGLDLEIVEGDLADRPSLARAVNGVCVVYHLAADYRLWVRDPSSLYQINVEGTKSLMREAADAGVERIVYTSSVATLGINKDGTAADENTPVSAQDMVGHYKRSKYMAEERIRDLIHTEGLPVVIVNPSAPIGPDDIKPTPTGRMVLKAAQGAMPAFVDTGLNVAHVDDIATGHLLACERGEVGERYILGGENLTLAEILAEIARLIGRKPPKVKLPHSVLWPVAFMAESWARGRGQRTEPFLTLDALRMSKKRMFFSHEKAARHLGYRPRPAVAGFSDALDWFKERGYLS